MMLRPYLALIILVSLSFSSLAQELKNLEAESPWNKGIISLTDGTRRWGEIYYNDNVGQVSIRTNDSINDTNVFERSHVLFLEYFNDYKGIAKKYNSITFSNIISSDIPGFEIIKEFKDFIVISKKDNVEIHTIRAILPSGHYGIPVKQKLITGSSQFEKIYFLKKGEAADLYLASEYVYAKGDLRLKRDGSQIFNSSILSKYLGDHFSSVMKYVKENNICLDSKEGITKALNFYIELLYESY